MFADKDENPFDLMRRLPSRLRPIPETSPCFLARMGDIEVEISARGDTGFELLKRSGGQTTAMHQIRSASTLGIAEVEEWIESVRYDLISRYSWNKDFIVKRHVSSLTGLVDMTASLELDDEYLSDDARFVTEYVRSYEHLAGIAHIRCNDKISLVCGEVSQEVSLRSVSSSIGIKPSVAFCRSTAGSVFLTSSVIRLQSSAMLNPVQQMRILSIISKRLGPDIAEEIQRQIYASSSAG